MNKANFLKSIGDKIIIQGLWTLICFIVAGLAAFLISRDFHFSTLEIVLGGIIVFLLFGLISYLIYRRNNKRLPLFHAMDCNFEMIREERVHKWISQDAYIHKRRYRLKALKNGLTHYTDKFCWTGTEYSLSGGNAEYTVEQEHSYKNIFDVYNFKFTTPLKKNDIIELEAVWNAKGPAKTFFSTTIEEPTSLLIMTVMLFPGCGVTKINCDTESYKGARVPIVSSKQTLNSDGEFTWTINNPKLLYHYEINWKLQI